jgi:hypothetical protein
MTNAKTWGYGVQKHTRFLIVKIGFLALGATETIMVLHWMGLTWK